MKHTKYSLFVFMIIVLILAGITGYSNFESYSAMEAFHATIGSLTFSGGNSQYSDMGELLNTMLTLASAAVIVWAFVNFHLRSEDVKHNADQYFKVIPQDEGLVLKEIKINKNSHLAGIKKIDVLQRTGSVVMGIRKGSVYQLNIPFTKKISAGTKALFLGTATQLKEVEKEAKK